ncbi:hypothetical protein ACFFU8_18250 [Chromobacterium piscinae]|uniref:hypothetical protein n=1 Tax=Chromobacterium piscinae TaxID=686831 RepID=UPI001E2EA3B3|nr:hypothetical protein [Chromobacterium piscinae]MCD5326741.1 hypothetical protein [Chromobacterium piscinae]
MLTGELVEITHGRPASSCKPIALIRRDGSEEVVHLHEQNFSNMQNFKQAEYINFCKPFISQIAKNSYHLMMDIDVNEIRRRNLKALLAPRGAAARIASATGSSESYLSTLKGKSRQLGSDLARRIEQAEGLPHGWFDQLHEEEAELASSKTETSAFTKDELIAQIGELETDELHLVITRALEYHAKKKAP